MYLSETSPAAAPEESTDMSTSANCDILTGENSSEQPLLPKTRSCDDLVSAMEHAMVDADIPPAALTRRLSDPNIATDPNKLIMSESVSSQQELVNGHCNGCGLEKDDEDVATQSEPKSTSLTVSKETLTDIMCEANGLENGETLCHQCNGIENCCSSDDESAALDDCEEANESCVENEQTEVPEAVPNCIGNHCCDTGAAAQNSAIAEEESSGSCSIAEIDESESELDQEDQTKRESNHVQHESDNEDSSIVQLPSQDSDHTELPNDGVVLDKADVVSPDCSSANEMDSITVIEDSIENPESVLTNAAPLLRLERQSHMSTSTSDISDSHINGHRRKRAAGGRLARSSMENGAPPQMLNISETLASLRVDKLVDSRFPIVRVPGEAAEPRPSGYSSSRASSNGASDAEGGSSSLHSRTPCSTCPTTPGTDSRVNIINTQWRM